MVETKRSSRISVSLIGAGLIIFLLALYVLGIGPAMWLTDQPGVSDEFSTLLGWLYLPLLVLAQACQPLANALAWYLHFWA